MRDLIASCLPSTRATEYDQCSCYWAVDRWRGPVFVGYPYSERGVL